MYIRVLYVICRVVDMLDSGEGMKVKREEADTFRLRMLIKIRLNTDVSNIYSFSWIDTALKKNINFLRLSGKLVEVFEK